MSVKNIKSSLFNLFNPNDSFLYDWADNVYDKIKNSRILPNYIKRSRENSKSPLILVGDPVFEKDNRFTYGVKLKLDSQTKLNQPNKVNLGRNFEFNFEVDLFGLEDGSSIVVELDSIEFISIMKNGSGFDLKCYGDTLSTIGEDFFNLKVKRDHSNHFIYIDSVLLSTKENNTLDSVILGDFVTHIGDGYSYISNIKFLSLDNEKIKCWWRLNFYDENFRDAGTNSYDFYSLWYSIIFLFSLVIRFSKFFRQDDLDIEFIKRFLDSKGVFYSNSYTYQELFELYSNWSNVLSERSTKRVYSPKDSIKNYHLSIPEGYFGNVSCELNEYKNFGVEVYLSFFVMIKEGLSYSIFGSVSIQTNSSETQFGFNFSDNGRDIIFSFQKFLNEGFHKFEIIRDISGVNCYVDGSLVDIDLTSNEELAKFGFSQLFDVIPGCKVSDIKIVYIESGQKNLLNYKLNEKDTLVVNEVLKRTEFEGRLFGFTNYNANQLWEQDGLGDSINNDTFKQFNGELINLYEKSNSELHVSKAGSFDLSWVIGNSSPLSSQTYPIHSFNRLPNKVGIAKNLSNFPIRNLSNFEDIFTQDGKIVITKLPEDQLGSPGSFVDFILSSSNYKKDWLVRCDMNRSYEVSFRMEVSGVNPDFNLNFRIQGTGTKNVKTNNNSVNFISSKLFEDEGYYWIRGIIYAQDLITTNRDVGLSVDPENTNHLKFNGNVENPLLLMNIRLADNGGNDCEIAFYDFQFRLLSIPMTKVSLGQKNIIFVAGKNNSGKTNEQIHLDSKKLIPFNSQLITL